jgi:hypothetical protein
MHTITDYASKHLLNDRRKLSRTVERMRSVLHTLPKVSKQGPDQNFPRPPTGASRVKLQALDSVRQSQCAVNVDFRARECGGFCVCAGIDGLRSH